MLNYDTWMHKNRKQEVKLKENDCDRKKKKSIKSNFTMSGYKFKQKKLANLHFAKKGSV